MAEGLVLAWGAGILGYAIGLVVHLDQAARYRRYRPRARHRGIVGGWIFDETNRAVVKAILLTWGLARLGLIAERSPAAVSNPTILDLDLLTLALYWTLLLVFTHWTWRVRRQRQHSAEFRGQGANDGH